MSKHINTHSRLTSVRDVLHGHHRTFATIPYWNKAKSKIQSVANRSMLVLKKNLKNELLSIISNVNDNLEDLKARSESVFSDYYIKAFGLGMKASGLGLSQSFVNHKNKYNVPDLNLQDKQWLIKASSSELKYWLNFLKQIKGKSLKRFTAEQRVDMYVEALDAQFDSGRVTGAPQHSFIYWTTTVGERCKTCLFLGSISPLPKELVVSTPKSSVSPCRTFCKCTIYVKTVPYDEYRARLNDLPTKHQIIEHLKTLSTHVDFSTNSQHM